ncbi:putative immunity protein [Pedobacter heparinus]|uniref:putative immunity protein n=1 Tax=Pedobacter heparinus TaxID=984 RepID=UPI002930D0F8|nr:hypothetical protein [Pedobacter heparinus]
MRDKRFIAEHRGGTLLLKNHHSLMAWAISCSEHALLLARGKKIDDRLTHALKIAEEWKNGKAKTGVAMQAAYLAHTAAREETDPVLKSVARSISQCVSTAHMADHSVGAALYALQAFKHADKSVKEELAWQKDQLNELPVEIATLVLETIGIKIKGFKDLFLI